MSWYSETPEGLLVNVRAQPRSSKPGIDGIWNGEALKVKIRAAPVEGKANKEIIEVVAEAFGVPKNCVSFKGGETSKTKRIFVAGANSQSLRLAQSRIL